MGIREAVASKRSQMRQAEGKKTLVSASAASASHPKRRGTARRFARLGGDSKVPTRVNVTARHAITQVVT
jgi:hypothetical protein